MRYDAETASVVLSVRELCAMTLCGGDLEFGGGRTLSERGRIGTEVHKKLRAERDGRYRAEVALTNTCLCGSLCYTVSGRADGVTEDEDGFLIEEIKSMRSRAYHLPVPKIYTAQLWIYGHFFCAEHSLPGIRLRMTCVNIDTDDVREHTETVSAERLREFYLSLLADVEYWAKLLVRHTLEDLPAMAKLPFPYHGMRLGQEEMIRSVFRTVKRGKRLFVQAPTGIGKTMSALYPAVRARGEETCDRIFYLTAKASTRHEAFEAARRLCGCGAGLRTVVLTAREQICPHPAAQTAGRSLSGHCNSVECEYAAGYYDKAGDALRELLDNGKGFTRESIRKIAEKHKVCPYELSLDLSEYCDLIIADYNYAFDPFVFLRRYFAPGAPAEGKNIFLIDEAHNLADRARDMFSATLSRRAFEALYAKVDRRDRVLNEALETVILAMRGLKKLCRDTLETDENGNDRAFTVLRTPLSSFNERLAYFSEKCDGWMRAHGEEEIAPRVRDLARTVWEYQRILDAYDEHFVTCLSLADGDTEVKLFCLDPSHVLDLGMHRATASVLFSATMTPLRYFADVLGGGDHADRLALPSPYDKERFGLFAVRDVSTRYAHRAESAREIAGCIAATVSAKKGNYIVYFPSYAYLEEVFKQFSARYPKVTTVVQKRGMRASEKETFLDAFPADEGVLRVGFCVLGGSFSEGVDLPGSRLIGSVIVGVGLPGLSNERNVLSEYYQNRSEMGFQYAYVYPGMNHVLQAAGRVIRREEDRGVVVLIDDRYASPEYRELFPPHWNHIKYAGNARELAELTRIFWEDGE